MRVYKSLSWLLQVWIKPVVLCTALRRCRFCYFYALFSAVARAWMCCAMWGPGYLTSVTVALIKKVTKKTFFYAVFNGTQTTDINKLCAFHYHVLCSTWILVLEFKVELLWILILELYEFQNKISINSMNWILWILLVFTRSVQRLKIDFELNYPIELERKTEY